MSHTHVPDDDTHTPWPLQLQSRAENGGGGGPDLVSAGRKDWHRPTQSNINISTGIVILGHGLIAVTQHPAQLQKTEHREADGVR